MHKRLRCVLPIVFLGIILVDCQMNSEQKSAKKENKTSKHVSHQKMTKKQQLAYLKEHEQEIIDFIKSQNKKIESVQIDWEQVSWGEASNGTPQGGGEVIYIFGGFNNNSDSSWRVDVQMNERKSDFETMYLGQEIRIGGKIFE